MKKTITKPKQRASTKMIKKKGKGVVATSGKKRTTTGKSNTAPEKKENVIFNQEDSTALKKIKTENLQLTRELQQKNRALEIEAALERVRFRTMAMHNSDELREVVAILYAQMTPLGLAPRGCELILCDEETELLQYWSVAPGAELPDYYPISRKSHPFFQKSWQAWKKRTPRLVVTLRGLEKKKFDKHIFEMTAFTTFPERAKKIIKAEKVDVFSMVTMKYGLLEAADTIPLPEDKFPILERFAQVFEQTYTRFLDLQKAEAQAKEAEIQLGLERVRAASMAMHESKELTKIVALVYEQLSILGFDAWSYLIRTREDTREGFTTWLSLKEMSVLPEGYHLPKLNHPIHKKVMKAWDDQLEYHVIGFEGKEKKQYDNLLFTKTEWKKFPKKVKDAFRSMNRAVVCSSNFKQIGLQAAGTEPLPEEQAKILIRFAKAFEQTYTRFLDLQKAEAQAKEAEIELALERVRAKTMAMQKSEELRELVFEYYKQIHPFGFAKWGFEIKIAKEDKSGFYCWISPPGARIQPEGFNIPTLDHWVLKKYWSVYEQQIPITSIVNSGADKRKLAVLLLEKSDMKNLPEDVKANIMETEYVHFSVAAMRFGLLKAVDMEPVPEKDASILQRFAKVFEQTYTRFLDLQKAEAQAREAQIEAALERVRSKTMAMHNSLELLGVVEILYLEMSRLDVELTRIVLLTINPETLGMHWWMANPEMNFKAKGYLVPHNELPMTSSMIEAWKNKLSTWWFNLEGKNKEQYDNFIFTKSELSQLPKEVRTAMSSLKQIYISGYCDNFGILTTSSLATLSSSNADLLVRFGKVFEQSYTRFLDLQRAEAQAREAQIEVALERIRSRMMAMHKTDELHEVLGTVFTQLQSLGFDAPGSALIIYNKDLAAEHWMTGFSGGQFPESYKIPYNAHPYFTDLLHAWQNGVPFQEFFFEGDLKIEYAKWSLENSDFRRMPPEFKKEMVTPDRMVISDAFNKYGMIEILGTQPLPEESINVLKRCSKVFEQTYTRFLDLQKAEAQAREAQIEAALERIRARTMAMQKTNELLETAGLLYKELFNLGIASLTSGYVLMDKDEKTGWNYDSSPADGSILPEPLGIPHTETKVMRSITASWKKQKPFDVIELDSQETIEHQTFIAERTPNFPYTAKELIAFSPERLVLHTFNFKEGYLLSINGEKLATDQIEMLIRFTRAFEQTYTRFLDLQKAEAQAREAQIEIALERIRARALAMHSSEELLDVARVLREQMGLLGQQQLHGCVVELYETNPDDIESWHAFRPEGTKEDKMIEGKVYFAKDSCAVIREMIERYRGPENEYTIEASGDKLDEWHAALAAVVPEVRTYWSSMESMPATMYFHCADFSGGTLLTASADPIANEVKGLQARAANVFDLAYRRFLDLKKAEAQAREARIEAALERIRSRTMAMHKSDELSEVASLLFQQIGELGIKVWTAGFNVWLNNDRAYQDWITSPKGGFIEPYIVDTTQFPVFIEVREAKQSGDDFFVQYVGGETIKAMYGELSKFAPQQFEIMLQDGFEFPKHQYDHFVFGSTVSLMFITFEPLPEAHDIFKRFGKVFEQTYTRFLDLQKAEAQAREAQIEAALERVRASAMAMHKSDDLRHVVAVVFKELELSLNIQICILLIFNAEATEIEWWSTGMVTDVLLPQSYKVPLADMIKENKLVQRYLGALQHGLQYDVFELSGETKRSWDRYLFEHTELKHMPKETQEAMMSFECVFLADAFMSHGTLEIAGPEPLPEDKGLILQRFAKVIDLTYRRVEDLQKAEAQAREAQIEAALERVRSRSMAMQKSTELNIILATMFTELSSLGVEMARNVIWIYNPEDRSVRWWAANPEAESGAESYLITYQDHPVYHEYWKAWEERRTKYLYILEGENMVSWGDALFYRTELGKLPQEVQMAMRAPDRVYLYNTFNDFGVLFIVCLEPLPDEKFSIIERFGKVFDQSYTRFTDILKAEAQAREAQIEAGLERVRARAMAMHKTDELREAGGVLYQELAKLGIVGLTSAYSLMDEDEKMVWYYYASPADGSIMSEPMGTPNTETQPMRSITESWKKQEPYHIVELDAQETIAHQTFIAERSINFPYTAAELISFSPEELKLHTFNFKQGYLLQIGGEKLSADQIDIMLRFTKVFEMTYRRFLDLQQAEAQAREAKIEAALERVRSRSMAMHKSDELLDVVNTVFERMRDLNLPIDAAAIFVFEKGGYDYWFATSDSKYPTGMHLPTRGNQVVDDISNAREAHVDFFSKLYSFDDKNHFFHNIFENTDFRHIPDERKKFLLECESLSLSVALEKNSGIQLNSYIGKILSPKEVDILKRFTRVFEQAYTRFLDLQRAEAQAREAQIEAALERVRSRSMAMQQSTELNIVLATMFTELSSLGVEMARNVIWIYSPEDRSVRWWAANPEAESGAESYLITYQDHPVYHEYWKAWEERRTKYLYILEGENMVSWCDALFYKTELGKLPQEVQMAMRAPGRVYLYNTFNDFGVLFIVCLEPLPDETFSIIERFGKVFDQSYTRFTDIQKAEAREMEAIRQASLDRVRAEIASMRTAKDLERITPLIWKELNTLSVPFIRCGVFIMDEDLHIIHNFLSTPDGKAIASFELPYDTPGFVANILKHWREKKKLLDHWDENGMKNFAQVLVNQGIFTEPGQYLKTLPKEGLYLHMLPFLQGMLYVGNTSQLAPENLDLLLSLAEAFSTAYARYEDFNKLEAAKAQVDNTLVELKQTQAQLVQSEKMASLGQLTAGIAHEIQNPLNFVNNFSEVNEELLAEMKDELRNGKIDDALALADNVLENQKKINHHGKRADGIVKGMLQHSRSSSGIKEPTDINVLADEYLRLAYHGFRAKDKSFNAKFTTDFDPTIEAINVMPQEIGRVILNLINNAFYAVTEKQKQAVRGYEPSVTVSTKNLGDKILISVKDNGNGIPDSIKEKIFQPFFTTKPTGQGTGLGLSLSYDIVKAHGGEISVESEEAKGTQFTIRMPLS